MINKFTYLLLLGLILSGCGKSLIELSLNTNSDSYPMYGKTTSREFFIPVTVSDSLVMKWESDAYGSFSNSTITAYDNYVFTSDQGGRIFVFNIDDGKQVGMLKSKESIYSAPLLFNSLIVYAVVEENTYLTQLIYYDYKNGKEVKLIEIEGQVLSEMVALEDGVVFLTESGDLYRFDLNGREVWKFESDERTRCSPALYNNTIIFGNDVGEILSVNLNTGNLINSIQAEGIFSGSASIDNELVYLSNFNGSLYCINIHSLEIIWEFDTGSKLLMTPAFDNENVFIGNLSGTLLSINKKNGELNWQKKYGGVFNASPLLTNNRIIISDLFRAYHIIDKNSGSLVKTISLEGRAKLTPVIFDSTLFIGYDRGILRAYEFVY